MSDIHQQVDKLLFRSGADNYDIAVLMLVAWVGEQRAEAAADALEQFSVDLAELRISAPNATGSYRKASRRAWHKAQGLRAEAQQ